MSSESGWVGFGLGRSEPSLNSPYLVMTRSYSVFAPALSTNAILDLSIPVSTGTSKKELSEVCVVRHYDLKNYVRGEEEQAPLGTIKRIAVGQGRGEAGDDQIVSTASVGRVTT